LIRAGILGASGYGGSELIRRLARHPGVELSGFASRQFLGQPLSACWPQLAGLSDASFTTDDEVIAGADVVFFATPHAVTAPLVARARAAGKGVIDLSADFRLEPAAFRQWYDTEHAHPELWPEARYGLVELHREELRGAALVASPGCNATAGALALAPLAAAGLLGHDITVNIATGISGAGRATSLPIHFPEAMDSVVPYRIAGTHRHIGEIEATLGRITAAAASGNAEASRNLQTHGPQDAPVITFTPQRVPMARGILASTATRPETGRNLTTAGLLELYRDYYEGNPLLHVQDSPPETKAVSGSDRALISVALDSRSGMILAFTALDNLGKGAAGQAVQAFNIAYGLPETQALELEGRWP
jgi:N-acetyl-gamma-glutamyl-phosphate reductase